MSSTSNTQLLSETDIRRIFRNLESGDGQGFFEHGADDVDWIVEGTIRLPGIITPKPNFSHIRLTSSQKFCRRAPNRTYNIF